MRVRVRVGGEGRWRIRLRPGWRVGVGLWCRERTGCGSGRGLEVRVG